MDQLSGLPVSPADTPESAQAVGDVASATHSGPSHLPSSHSASSSSLNPRSCVTCRRRKVKCNKQYPCSNCLKAHIDCIFPAPGRAPRRPRKPPDGELLARLRRLEGVVHSLGVQVDDEPRLSGASLGEGASKDRSGVEYGSPSMAQRDSPMTDEQRRTDSLANEFGRLVVNEGRSRYINNRYWASLSDEVEDLKQVLDESSDEEPDSPSPSMDTMATPSQHGFMFNNSSSANDLHNLHPSPEHIKEYWHLFVEHCDPLMKMLHVPSTQEQIYAVMHNPGKASKAIEVLLFAIYYSSVTSLSPEECLKLTGETQEILAKRFRFGLEQALVRAHFLVTEEIVVLQAFIIFLICLRRFEDPRVIWSLCGVACRIAITLGLHCDGSHLGISPMEIEIRRRTWWQILILDIRSSEDHGSDPVIIQHSFDTRFPLNVEDEDLTFSMVDLPPERIGITKMSFCLVRYYSAKTFARLFARPAAFLSPTGAWPESTLQEKQRWIQVCQETLQERFFRHCDMRNPLHWVTYTVSKLILAKQWLILYQPFQRMNLGASLPPETRDRLFMLSLDSIESAVQLEKERKTVKWGWLFKTYTQFHALAFILSDLTRRTSGPLVDRAWHAVNESKEVFWDTDSDIKKGPLMKPLMKLEMTARAAKLQAEAQEKQNPGQQQQSHSEAAQPADAIGDPEFATMNLQNAIKIEFDPQTDLQHVNGMSSGNNQRHTGFNDPVFSNTAFGGNFYVDSMGNPVHNTTHFPSAQPNLSQWQDTTGPITAGTNTVPMGDWFTDPTFGAMPIVNGSGVYNIGQQLQHHQQQHGISHGHSEHEQKYPAGDPMVGGSEGQEMRWEEWDEMFDTVMQGQGAGPPGQWQRGQLMGETWL